jgi:Rubrerythrin
MQDWLDYFQARRALRPTFAFTPPMLTVATVQALVHSLRRFELGESGDGNRLKAHAAALGEPAYEQAIALFIQEEQDHARWLGELLATLNVSPLTWHWSDALFVWLRRRMGLKTELCVLLVAEMIAKRYYAALRDGIPDRECKRLFSQICLDEEGHLAFHTAYLTDAFRQWSAPACLAVWLLWWGFYRVACLAVMLDHHAILRATGVSQAQFWRDTGRIFAGISGQIFGGEGVPVRTSTPQWTEPQSI